MAEALNASCPYCGEPVEVYFDAGGGKRQVYVEDCPVCCRPWQVEVIRDDVGEWDVTLQTSD